MAPQDFAVGQSSAPIDIIIGFARPSVSFEQGFCAFESDFGICNGGIAFGDGRFGLRNLLRAISILHLAEVGFEQVALRPELSDGVLEIHFSRLASGWPWATPPPSSTCRAFMRPATLKPRLTCLTSTLPCSVSSATSAGRCDHHQPPTASATPAAARPR